VKQIGSAIITPPKDQHSRTGTPHGGHGLATRENSERVAAWLAKQAPEDMDKAAVSRASQHGVGLRVKTEGRYPSGPNGERLPCYVIATGCEIAPGGDVKAALSDLRNFMTPAPIRQIEAWLAELSVIVAKRQGDEMEESLRLTAYAGRLSRYPADVAKAVTTGTSYKFWPSWEEMEKRCEILTSPRRQMIAALERGPAKPEREYRAPTAEEKIRIEELVQQMFPLASAAERKDAVDLAVSRTVFMTGGE
jgi:hypothetical protein